MTMPLGSEPCTRPRAVRLRRPRPQGERTLVNRATLDECELHQLFDRLFPNGFDGADVRAELAPDEPTTCEWVAACLWDVFSDNHDVIAPDGRLADIGSFRGAAGFLAAFLNAKLGTSRYGYLDFYMGTLWKSPDADPSPVYRMIFRRLQREGCAWHYCDEPRHEQLIAAHQGPLPPTVQAYRDIYGHSPQGWPP